MQGAQRKRKTEKLAELKRLNEDNTSEIGSIVSSVASQNAPKLTAAQPRRDYVEAPPSKITRVEATLAEVMNTCGKRKIESTGAHSCGGVGETTSRNWTVAEEHTD